MKTTQRSNCKMTGVWLAFTTTVLYLNIALKGFNQTLLADVTQCSHIQIKASYDNYGRAEHTSLNICQ